VRRSQWQLNPLAVILLLPVLPLVLPLLVLASLAQSETVNLEEWVIEEDESGRIHITVHRHVRRG